MSLPSVTKQPTESRLYSMDFSALMGQNETISAVSSVTKDKTTTPDLTIGAAVFDGQIAQFRLSAGKSGTKYKITCIVTTSDGNTLEGEGIVQLEDL